MLKRMGYIPLSSGKLIEMTAVTLKAAFSNSSHIFPNLSVSIDL